MRVLVALLCAALSASPADGFFEGTCLKEEPAPGVLVVAPGSHLSLTCGGQVMLDGVNVAILSKTPTARGVGYTTPHMPSPASVHLPSAITNIQMFLNKTRHATRNTITVAYNTQSTMNIGTGGNRQQTRSENSRKQWDGPLRRASPEHKATPTATTLQPSRGDPEVALAESFWPVGDEDNEANYGNGEEGGRVGRPQWRLNGRTLSFREGVFERDEGAAVFLSSVSADDSGRYSCHYRGKVLSSVKVVVAAPPEQPILTCYKKSPSSKIRCDWTPQQPIVVQPHCYLYLRKGTSDSFSRVNCSFSGRLWRCWCVLDHYEEEKRVLHMAYLCVTSTAGNATSTLHRFIPLGIIKPEPPSAVAVRAVEGREKMLRVNWSFPCSWKRSDRYYELIYEISYRPSSGSQALQNHSTKNQQYTIVDVLPMVEYVIQLRAKDEYDGLWSDWSTPIYGYSWTVPSAPLWSTDLSTTLDPLYTDTEGSGIEYPSISKSEQIQDQVWHHILWISGLCVLLSLALAVYAFRHREKFVSKLHNLNVCATACATVPHPLPHTTTTTSTPQPQEGHTLVTFTPTCYKYPLPNEVEEEEEEDGEDEKREPERKPEKRCEAISFNNTSYFLLQRDREKVPQQPGPKCLK